MNDQKIMDYLQQKLSELTRELKETQDAYAELQSRPSPTTEREAFLLEELERVNLQLECKTLFGSSRSILCNVTRLRDDEPFAFAQVFALTR